jgi:hypothetical protein
VHAAQRCRIFAYKHAVEGVNDSRLPPPGGVLLEGFLTPNWHQGVIVALLRHRGIARVLFRSLLR